MVLSQNSRGFQDSQRNHFPFWKQEKQKEKCHLLSVLQTIGLAHHAHCYDEWMSYGGGVVFTTEALPNCLPTWMENNTTSLKVLCQELCTWWVRLCSRWFCETKFLFSFMLRLGTTTKLTCDQSASFQGSRPSTVVYSYYPNLRSHLFL